MKNGLMIVLMTILLWSCGVEAVEKEALPSPDTSVDMEKNSTEEAPVQKIVDDEPKYSKAFLEKLNSAPPEMGEFELKEGMLILNGEEEYSFPSVPEFDEKMVFTAKKDELAVAITLERLNYTTVKYKIEMTEFGNASKTEEGTADMSFYFFLGSESDEDKETGLSYTAHEFTSSKDDCNFSIRIGDASEEGESEKLLVKLIKNCNGEIRDIGLDDFPALRQK